MPKKRTREQLIEAASEAHTDMALLEAVVKMCDGSDISANRFRTTQRIIQLCQNEQQRCLADYDRAVAEASE